MMRGISHGLRRTRCARFVAWLTGVSIGIGTWHTLAQADVFRWDNGQVIPGTQGKTLGPGVQLDHLSLLYAALQGKDLRGANFAGSNLRMAHLDGTNLSLANFDGAIVNGTRFIGNTWIGFRKEQLYSTASYQAHDLSGIQLWNENLTGWDFSDQDLTSAFLPSSNLTNADLTRAVITAANLGGTTLFGLTKEQLYTTASFQRRNLRQVGLWANDLTAWDLSSQDLTGASLASSTLRGTKLDNAIVRNANLSETTSIGFTAAQLYSTASYQAQDLTGIKLSGNNLNGWNLGEQRLAVADFGATNLVGTHLQGSDLSGAYFGPVIANDRIFASMVGGADFQGANLKNASFVNTSNPIGGRFPAEGVDTALFSAETVYNQYTIFPQNFDPVATGLTFVRSELGDVDGTDGLSVGDVNYLSRRIRDSSFIPWQSALFDLNLDSSINTDDLKVWVTVLKQTWFGDANLDGEFNSTDLIDVLQAGEYEDALENNSTWATGDWDADGDFTTTDLVVSFQDGGYELGPRFPAQAVPEPASVTLLAIGVYCCCALRQKRRARKQARRASE